HRTFRRLGSGGSGEVSQVTCHTLPQGRPPYDTESVLLAHSSWSQAGKRCGIYLGAVVLISGVMGIGGWAAVVSYAAIFNLQGLDAIKLGQQVGLTCGALALVGAFALLAAQAA